MEQRTNVVEIDVKDMFDMLLHKVWLIGLVTVICALVFRAASTYMIQPTYTSTTKIYVVSRQDESKMTLTDLQTGTQLTMDYMVLVRSRPVLERVIQQLNIPMSPEELYNCTSVVSPQGTRILEITVAYIDPIITKKLADAIAQISSEQMINIMELKKVNIVEEGNLPTAPSSPNVNMNTMLGGIIGLLATCVVLIIVRTLDDSIKTSDDVEKYLSLITLGLIPVEDGIDKKGKKLRYILRKKSAVA